MQQPLFVMTSRGFINLSLVQYIIPETIDERDCIRFVFREDENVVDAIDLPAEEGKRVTDILQMERPELFVAA